MELFPFAFRRATVLSVELNAKFCEKTLIMCFFLLISLIYLLKSYVRICRVKRELHKVQIFKKLSHLEEHFQSRMSAVLEHDSYLQKHGK